MLRRFTCSALLGLTVLLGLSLTAYSQDPQSRGVSQMPLNQRFEVPEGFYVETVYGPNQSGSITALTFDQKGRLVFAREDSTVVRLLGPGPKGQYTEQVVSTQVTGCQGLVFDGPDLLAVGNGPEGPGLYRIIDQDADGKGDRVTTLARSTGAVAGHGPHGVLWGPDGYLYWMVGNHAGIQSTPAPGSPHSNYREGHLLPSYVDPRGHANSVRAPGGVLLRKNLQAPTADWEMVAGGFRNAYDAAFNLEGELFTFDSDMEWDINLPWYRPVRTVHVVPGGEYGWRTGSRKWPAYAPENLPGITNVGRGSPTGVAFYHHSVYPPKYHGAVFYGDWSRGRILVGFPKRAGASYTETLEPVVEGHPLNVIDLTVGPDGYLYFGKGGWDTDGGIYRLAHKDGPERQQAKERLGQTAPARQIEQALTQPQPRSAWGRARIDSLQKIVGPDNWQKGLFHMIGNQKVLPERRRRALELMQVHGPGLKEQTLIALGDDSEPQIRAASTYYLGLHASPQARQELVKRLHDADALVQRRAAEALIRSGVYPAEPLQLSLQKDLFPLLGASDRLVRYAARELLERINRNRWREKALALETYPQAVEALLALVETSPGTYDVPALLQRERELLAQRPLDNNLLKLLRVVQQTMVRDREVWHGQEYAAIGKLLQKRFPSGNQQLDYELARTLSYIKPAGLKNTLVKELTEGSLPRQQQIFYVYCLRTLKGEWSEEHWQPVAQWFAKTQDEDWRGGASFKAYLGLLWEDFLALLTPEQAKQAQQIAPGDTPENTAKGKAFRRASYSQTLSQEELRELLIFDPTSYKGNAEKGKAAFKKAFCSSCHRVGAVGSGGGGPDLTTVGQRFDRKDLVEAILYPNRTVSDRWAAVQVAKKEGGTVTGTLTEENGSALKLQTPSGRLVTVAKDEVRTQNTTSPMPKGLLHNLSRQEMVDLLLFLEQGSQDSDTR